MITLRKRAYPILVRPHVRGAALTPAVVDELRAYFAARPAIRAGEAADHGFDPLTDPKKYLAVELAEPAHQGLRSIAELTPADIDKWATQEDAEWDHVSKDSPTADAVHVDRPLGSDGPAKKRKRDDELEDLEVTLVKADSEQRIVYGIVLEPDVEDSQGDIVSKEDIELAAHRFLYSSVKIGDQHHRLAPDDVRPVESYIAPCDFELGGQAVTKGSWVLAAHVPDDDLWDQVRKGQKGAWSVAGTGQRIPL